MDCSQSMSNIESIKQFVRLFNESSYLFFDFSDLKNFKVTPIDDAKNLIKLRVSRHQQKLPTATMAFSDTGEEILYYCDEVIHLEYNLTFGYILEFYIRTDLSKPENKEKILNQLTSLKASLKK